MSQGFDTQPGEEDYGKRVDMHELFVTYLYLFGPPLTSPQEKNAPWKVPVRQEFLVGHVQALQFLNTFVSALDGHVLFRFLFSISNTRVC